VAEGDQDRREGRGRLSSIDLLPDEAEEDIRWALDQLRARSIHQNLILDQFNARLASRGIKPVSKSAFSRWTVRKAIQFRRLDEVRTITNEIAAAMGSAGADESTVALAEMVKAQIYETLEAGGAATKDLRGLSASLKDLAIATRASTENRKRIEEREAGLAEKVADHVEAALRDHGIPAARIKQQREEFLGVRKPATS